jgi:hypothetical protein
MFEKFVKNGDKCFAIEDSPCAHCDNGIKKGEQVCPTAHVEGEGLHHFPHCNRGIKK